MTHCLFFFSRNVSHVMAHPLRGALFEIWAIMELIKAQCNAGLKSSVCFLRDKQGHELDAVIELGTEHLLGIEIKSGATIASDFFNGLEYWRCLLYTSPSPRDQRGSRMPSSA